MVSAASDPSEFPRHLTVDEVMALADPATRQSIRMVERSKVNRRHLSKEPLFAITRVVISLVVAVLPSALAVLWLIWWS